MLLKDITKWERYVSMYKENIGKYYQSSQDSLRLYTWGNPGYSQLKKLQEAVDTIEKFSTLKAKIQSTKQGKPLLHVSDWLKIVNELKSQAIPNGTGQSNDYHNKITQYVRDIKEKYATKIYLSTTELKHELSALIDMTREYDVINEYENNGLCSKLECLINDSPLMQKMIANDNHRSNIDEISAWSHDTIDSKQEPILKI